MRKLLFVLLLLLISLPATVLGQLLPSDRVYCLGDSITSYGNYGTLGNLLGNNWLLVNDGVSGNTSSQMLARLGPEVLNNGDARYLLVLGGINDLINDVPAATVETNLQAIYTAAHGAGVKVVAVTLLPFKGSPYWTCTRQSALDAVNAWIINTSADVDYKVNAYPLLEDQANPDALKPDCDGGDHLHLSAAGNNQLANAVYGAVTWTQNLSPYYLHLSAGASLNQDVSTSGSPRFFSLNLTGGPLGVGGMLRSLPPVGRSLVIPESGAGAEVFYLNGMAYFQGYNRDSQTFFRTQFRGNPVIIDPDTGGVSIGPNNPNPASLLEMQSTTKGFGPPRMTSAQRQAIANPYNGLWVHDLTLHAICFYENGWKKVLYTDAD